MNYVFQMRSIMQHVPILIQGLKLTITMWAFAAAIGLVTGWCVALASMSSRRLPRTLAVLYIEFWRNTPLLIQLLFVYFGFTALTKLSFTAIQAGMIALVLNTTAYNAEIIRGGLQAIPKVQMESAKALGLSWLSVLRAIVIPWTMKVAFPSLVNQLVLMLLGTSVLSIIAVPELMNEAKHLQTITGRTIEIYLLVTVMYVATIMLMSAIFGFLEVRYFSLVPISSRQAPESGKEVR